MFILGVSFCSHAQTAVPSIATITIDNIDLSLPYTGNIEVSFKSANPEKVIESIQEYEGIKILAEDDNIVTFSLSQSPRFIGKRKNKYKQDSFVIDFKEQSMKEFLDEFALLSQSKINKKNSILQVMTDYVSEYISLPTYIHGFNFASTVATSKSGDCTEYAVLLAALARANGLSSRVIIGTVIIMDDVSVDAVGHAWTEVWYNNEWHILDAALNNMPAQVYYMPTGELSNEGPGFAISLMENTILMPIKIINISGTVLR